MMAPLDNPLVRALAVLLLLDESLFVLLGSSTVPLEPLLPEEGFETIQI
jgi:hypothetical protein